MLARQDGDNFGQCVSAVLLLASCSGQYNALEENNATDPQSTLPQASDTAQIAEYVVEAFEDSKGNLWFGTINKGVARYDGKTLTYLTEEDG